MGAVYDYFNTHTVIDILIGLGWLTCFAAWPEIKPRLPVWLRIGKSPDERFEDLERHCGQFLGTEETFPKLHEDHGRVVERIGSVECKVKEQGILKTQLEDARIELGKRDEKIVSKLSTTIAEGLNALGETQKANKQETEITLTSLTTKINGLAQEISRWKVSAASGMTYLSELSYHLMYGCGQSVQLFIDITQRFPGTELSDRPFSNWPPVPNQEPQSEAVREGIRWKRHLSNHLMEFATFCQTRLGIVWQDRAEDRELLAYVAAWAGTGSPGVSRDRCLELLRIHYRAVQAVLLDYATNLSERLAVRPPIS